VSVALGWTGEFVALDWFAELLASVAAQLWFVTGEWFASAEVGFEESSEQQLVCLEEWCPWTEGPSGLADLLEFYPVAFVALAAGY